MTQTAKQEKAARNLAPETLEYSNAGGGQHVAVLTAGRDRPYAIGLAEALINEKIAFDFITSDTLDSPILHNNPLVTFLNLRRDLDETALRAKVIRVLAYYARLIVYAVRARPRIFHILWNNKFEWFDRTLLMLFYRLCGRKLVLTAHNVNAGSRDRSDSFMNRLTLRIQYRLAHHIFVHTRQMGDALQSEFGVSAEKCSVIHFPINSTVPDTALDGRTARASLGLNPDERVLLFFGNIAPYKGLDCLVEAMARVVEDGRRYRLVVAGRLKGMDDYWKGVQESIERLKLERSVLLRIEYIPDEDTEIYFKAADVLLLPYKYIFQSGVLFLGYNFGLPVVASDVGSLKDDIVEGQTGFVCEPENPASLAHAIHRYFDSSLYRNLANNRRKIREFAHERFSWTHVMKTTTRVYSRLSDSRH